jgi:hypothetical protein
MTQLKDIKWIDHLLPISVLVVLFILASQSTTWAAPNLQRAPAIAASHQSLDSSDGSTERAPGVESPLDTKFIYLPLILRQQCTGGGGTVPCRNPNSP